VRRQVPESWRRVLPVPLAAAGYGGLLGLGFTTFILSFAVWALAALCVALGDPALGALVGLGFGAGRALPVIALAPAADTDAGARVAAAMAERPMILRALRAVDAAALLVAALAVTAAPAHAVARTAQAAPAPAVIARGATDPSAGAGLLAWSQPGAPGLLAGPAGPLALPGRTPAVAPGTVAWRAGEEVVLADAATLTPRAVLDAPGGGPLALSERWLAWRAPRPGGGDRLLVRPLADSDAAPVEIAATRGRTQIGRPALSGDLLAWHVAGPAGSRIEAADLATGTRRVLRSGSGATVSQPALAPGLLLYVRATYRRQQLRLAPLGGGDERTLYGTVPTGRRDAGREAGRHRHRAGYRNGPPPLWPRPAAGVATTLWSTALDTGFAYVTRVVARRGRPTSAAILRVPVG
jgi:hypothetical protein